MCMHSGPDSDNGHRKKWRKCVQITRETTTTITIAKLLLTTITTTKKYAQWHFTKIYVCARSTLPFSFYVSLTLASSISHYAVCFVLCSAATSSSASRALCTAFYALPATPPSTSACPTAFRSCFNWESRLSQICIKRTMKTDMKFRR